MILGAVDSRDRDRWCSHPTSILLEHSGKCCRTAREWLIAKSRAFDFSLTENQTQSGPRFLSLQYQWGPNPWPIFWCQAVTRSTIDCGVFAAMAKEIFLSKGIQAANGQIIEQACEAQTRHYQALWRGQPGAFDWIGREHVYHEILVIWTNQFQARLYDPTEGTWLSPQRVGGLGAPVAARSEAPVAVNWGEHSLFPDQWTELAR